jgi:hypothetical protein
MSTQVTLPHWYEYYYKVNNTISEEYEVCDNYNKKYVTEDSDNNTDHVVMYARKYSQCTSSIEMDKYINAIKNGKYDEADINGIVKLNKMRKHLFDMVECLSNFSDYMRMHFEFEFHGICIKKIDLEDVNINTNIPIGFVYDNIECYGYIVSKIATLFKSVEKPQFGNFYLSDYEIVMDGNKLEFIINLTIVHVISGDKYIIMITPYRMYKIERFNFTSYYSIGDGGNLYMGVQRLAENSMYSFDVKQIMFKNYIGALECTILAMDTYKYCTVVDWGNFKYPKYSIETENECYITAHPAPYINIHTVCGHKISIHALRGIVTKGKLNYTEAVRCPQCNHDLIPAFEDIFKSEEQKYHFFTVNRYVNLTHEKQRDIANTSNSLAFDIDGNNAQYTIARNTMIPKSSSQIREFVPFPNNFSDSDNDSDSNSDIDTNN